MFNLPRPLATIAILVSSIFAGQLRAQLPAPADGTIRIATFNTSLFRDEDGALIRDLEPGNNEQAQKIAEVIQRIRPDIILLNEFDYDDAGRAAELFQTKYLAAGHNDLEPLRYRYSFTAPVNTGVPSGRDLGHNGKPNNPDDAFGFGRHPGQYGMLVLSQFPIDREAVRTFQHFLWRDMPNAMLPINPKTEKPFYDDDDLAVFRLSSKSFWDLPINVPVRGASEPFTLHLLCSHPTPPVFDGPEDRNGRRNHDEVRLIADYIQPSKSGYLKDDAGKKGGLPAKAQFVILGDLNSDPVDGQSVPGTMQQLLDCPAVDSAFTPISAGGPLTVEQHKEQFTNNRGNPKHVTSNFTGEGHGCLRIDYVLPSTGLEVEQGGIFWPKPMDQGADAVTATDHRSVWLDVRPKD
jgi:endonuclease/exonuclease/phosphatase family metal-dependent hydrolase